ncbi:hypothetical protein [Sphingomonas aerolata]|uniref:hypothetical protein n=1 Tax=Sphingomonas aerolata TaxID=185951 RepID=UPI002FE090A4
MDLKTFIAETLVAIIEGVADAQRRIAEDYDTAAISLLDRPGEEAEWRNPNYKAVTFDVAITSAQEDSKESGAKAGLKVYVLSASVDGKDAASTKSSSASRVQFEVPLHLPVMHSSKMTDARRAKRDAETAAIRGAPSPRYS